MKKETDPIQNDVADYEIDPRLKVEKDFPEELLLLVHLFREKEHPERFLIPWFKKSAKPWYRDERVEESWASVTTDRRSLASYQDQIALSERMFKEFFFIQKLTSKTVPEPFRSIMGRPLTPKEMKRKRKRPNRKEVCDYEVYIIGVLMGAVVLLGISACATVPSEPLGESELRLLKMQVSEIGNLRLGHSYRFNISFEAGGDPKIIRAVCFCSGDGPCPYNVEDVKYGSAANFTLYLSACQPDLQVMKCSVDYVRDGKRTRSNFVSLPVSAY